MLSSVRADALHAGRQGYGEQRGFWLVHSVPSFPQAPHLSGYQGAAAAHVPSHAAHAAPTAHVNSLLRIFGACNYGCTAGCCLTACLRLIVATYSSGGR
jgi:hypothetical protein